jgi:hypothetical protein
MKEMKILASTKKFWLLFSRTYRDFYYIKAGIPCNKGEIGILFLVIGWRKE